MLQRYNSDLTRYADLANGCIFGGTQIVDAKYLVCVPRKKSVVESKREGPEIAAGGNGAIKEEIVRDKMQEHEVIPNVTLSSGAVSDKVSKDEKITDHLYYTERERDFIWFHNHPDRKFYIACEAQAEGDYTMSLREFSYDGIEYTDQLESGRHKIKTKEGTKYLAPVIHMVLYHGWKRWLSKHSLQEMMDIPECLKPFRSIIPDYRSYVIDIHEQNPELFKTEWADVFRLMKHSRKKEELKKYVDEHMEEIRRLSKDTRILLAVLLDQYKIMEDGKVEVKDMCEAWDGAMQMYADEAAEKTERRMREEMNEMKKEAEKLANKFRKLVTLLAGNQEYEKLTRASNDAEYCQELYKAYGI